MSSTHTPKHGNGRAAAAGLAAGVLALAMATGINLGILGAAGNPKGPGALGGTEVVAVGRPGHDAGPPPARIARERRGEHDRGPERAEPSDASETSVTVSPPAPPSPAGGSTISPVRQPSWQPAPSWNPQHSPAGGGWTPSAGGSDSSPGGAETEHHHRFGANDDD